MNKVKIGALDYVIIEKDLILHDGVEVFGLCSVKASEIHILKSIGKPYKRHTLMHEITHAIASDKNVEFPPETEEKDIDKMAAGFLAFLRDNPSTVKYLTAKDKASASTKGVNK